MKFFVYIGIVALLTLGYVEKDYFASWFKYKNKYINIPSSSQLQHVSAGEHSGKAIAIGKYFILDIRRLLLARDFKILNETLEAFQRAYQQDVANEDDLLNVYMLSFAAGGRNYGELLDEWVENSPEAYEPYLARAAYYFNRGWAARGGKFAAETTDSQFAGMNDYFSKALGDIYQTLKMQQDNIVPYYFLINIYKAASEDGKVSAVLKEGLDKCPDSFRLRGAYMVSLQPRWGGSYDEMRRFAANELQSASLNPRIALLQGYPYYDAADMQQREKNYGAALELINKAIAFGELDIFFEKRASIYARLEKNTEALADLDAAIVMNSQDSDLYYRRAKARGKQDMLSEALDDLAVAEQLDPGDQDVPEMKKWLANRYYGKARKVAVGDNQFNAAQIDLDKAIELDPGNIDYYRLMDWLLVKRSDWDGIIRYWDRYLAINSNDGAAYLERGGAFFHKGDLASAVADAKRAADLGNVEGQKMYDRYKGQVAN